MTSVLMFGRAASFAGLNFLFFRTLWFLQQLILLFLVFFLPSVDGSCWLGQVWLIMARSFGSVLSNQLIVFSFYKSLKPFFFFTCHFVLNNNRESFKLLKLVSFL
jgi:hypothetical protein